AARRDLMGGLETPPSFAGQTLVSNKAKPWGQPNISSSAPAMPQGKSAKGIASAPKPTHSANASGAKKLARSRFLFEGHKRQKGHKLPLMMSLLLNMLFISFMSFGSFPSFEKEQQ
ncbi:MAG: hypothetical protein U9Q79_00580, partial [Candidatus Hydrogenedentes bacterium]|nr:hypothetical protein [Candidatus Hydrogenedentota bacterium]